MPSRTAIFVPLPFTSAIWLCTYNCHYALLLPLHEINDEDDEDDDDDDDDDGNLRCVVDSTGSFHLE